VIVAPLLLTQSSTLSSLHDHETLAFFGYVDNLAAHVTREGRKIAFER
jgi:hypothetical protein